MQHSVIFSKLKHTGWVECPLSHKINIDLLLQTDHFVQYNVFSLSTGLLATVLQDQQKLVFYVMARKRSRPVYKYRKFSKNLAY